MLRFNSKRKAQKPRAGGGAVEVLDGYIAAIRGEVSGRLLTTSQHFAKLGDAIEKTVTTYNDTVGSLERNVLTSARRFRDLRPASAQQLAEVEPIDLTPQPLDSSKWQLLAALERECAG